MIYYTYYPQESNHTLHRQSVKASLLLNSSDYWLFAEVILPLSLNKSTQKTSTIREIVPYYYIIAPKEEMFAIVIVKCKRFFYHWWIECSLRSSTVKNTMTLFASYRSFNRFTEKDSNKLTSGLWKLQAMISDSNLWKKKNFWYIFVASEYSLHNNLWKTCWISKSYLHHS